MNAVEIEEAITVLAEQPFDAGEFPFAFLQAFGNKQTTLKRLRTGATNKSDLGGVLQTNNIHIVACPPGEVTRTLAALKASPATVKAKARFVLATDGETLEAEDLQSDDPPVACSYKDFPDHFGFFLPLAGITTVKQIRESSFDIRATSRLNKLYLELLKDNPDWGTANRRPDMNHFMARLIFCFFAEDTDIFNGTGLFTATIDQMSAKDSSNTHEVIGELFRAMNTKIENRAAANLPRWANVFPYVNGGLFSGRMDVPRFSRIARSYLLHIGNLEWTKINPDIFGSMIQAVADDEERGALGMHYTSVPNILKVLNPLFLDDLRAKLEETKDNPRSLLNLRKRMAKIRVFDPACGSGNFLVIAYKEMRAIEAEINKRRGEADRRTEIPLTNFRGIELRDFPAEIARLALIIAEYQSDVLYRGQKEALAEFLPLDAENWITCGNALRLDWLSICPPAGTGVKLYGDDLFQTPFDQVQIDFENEGGETYICGNPPFSGTRKQTPEQKSDIEHVFSLHPGNWKNVDYVGGWFIKAAEYYNRSPARFAFVSTNSFCQGQQIPLTWSLLYKMGLQIRFAFPSFKWSNLASKKAGVTVVITGLDKDEGGRRFIYIDEERQQVDHINPYLNSQDVEIVKPAFKPIFHDVSMQLGVYYSKSAGLICTKSDVISLVEASVPKHFFRKFLGSDEFINGITRYCLWISEETLTEAQRYDAVQKRIDSVKSDRLATKDTAVNKLAQKPHQFREFRGDEEFKVFVPIISSESREYFPAGIASEEIIPTNKAFYIPNAPLWAMSVIVSKLHLSWISTVCGRLEMRYSYSSTLGWNTFPIPTLTEKNKTDLIRCAKDILLAREAHFPSTIADLYDPDEMPADLREAHGRNDEVLERIYIGRRFRNDTERLEKLFEMYTKMTAGTGTAKKKKAGASA